VEWRVEGRGYWRNVNLVFRKPYLKTLTKSVIDAEEKTMNVVKKEIDTMEEL
jgi:hypothetical protein